MVTNYPNQLAVVSIHLSDSYETSWGNNRKVFYVPGSMSIPFFALDSLQNAWPINTYEDKFNARKREYTDVTMALSISETSVDTFNITADVCIEAGGTGKTLRIYMVQVLDHYPSSPSHSRNCLMQGATTTDITVSAGSCDQVTKTFTFSSISMTSPEDIKIIAWAQEPLSSAWAEVHQAAKIQYPFMTAAFSHSPTNPTVGQTVQLTDESIGDIDTWSWDLGDGGSSSDQNPTHSYSTAGCYDVILTVGSGTRTDDATAMIQVGTPVAPDAAFSFTPDPPDENELVQFTDTSTGDINTWSWDFGDGGTSVDQNPSHTFTDNGTYDVVLTVDNGCDSDVITTQVTVCETVAPTASFSAVPNPAEVGETVTLTDLSSGEIVSWSWDFDDGGTSTAQNPTHAYAAAGTYDISLTVSSGCLEDSITIPVDVCLQPTADFGHSPEPGQVGVPIQFTDLSSADVVSWSWDFGDTGTSTAQNPTHAYAAGGTYTVILTVDNGCLTHQTSTTVSVCATPTAAFTYSPSLPAVDETIQFTDTSSGTPVSWSWDFGDGGTSTVQNPTHSYTSAGNYTVGLSVGVAGGCESTERSTVVRVGLDPDIFEDGFESGDTSGWSAAVQ